MQTAHTSARADKAPAFIKAIRSVYFLSQFGHRCEDKQCGERADQAYFKAMHQLKKVIADSQVPINKYALTECFEEPINRKETP